MRNGPVLEWFCVVYQKPVRRMIVPGEPCPLCHFPASSCGWRPRREPGMSPGPSQPR